MAPDKSYPSPNGHYRLDIFAHEVKMSHWIDCPYLYDTATGELLFHAGQLWDTKKVDWAENGGILNLELSHYPGAGNEIRVKLDLINGKAEIRSYNNDYLSGGNFSTVCNELSNTTEFRTLFY